MAATARLHCSKAILTYRQIRQRAAIRSGGSFQLRGGRLRKVRTSGLPRDGHRSLLQVATGFPCPLSQSCNWGLTTWPRRTDSTSRRRPDNTPCRHCRNLSATPESEQGNHSQKKLLPTERPSSSPSRVADTGKMRPGCASNVNSRLICGIGFSDKRECSPVNSAPISSMQAYQPIQARKNRGSAAAARSTSTVNLRLGPA